MSPNPLSQKELFGKIIRKEMENRFFIPEIW